MVIKFESSIITKIFSILPTLILLILQFAKSIGYKLDDIDYDLKPFIPLCFFAVYFAYCNRIVFYQDKITVRSAFAYWEMFYIDIDVVERQLERGGNIVYLIINKTGEEQKLDLQYYNSAKVVEEFYERLKRFPISSTIKR